MLQTPYDQIRLSYEKKYQNDYELEYPEGHVIRFYSHFSNMKLVCKEKTYLIMVVEMEFI
jgi:hypothetical protein